MPPRSGPGQGLAGEDFLYVFQGRAERAAHLAARVALDALPPTGIGREPSGRQASGRDAPAGPSPLPVRPLRLRPMAATAGGRARVTPGTAHTRLAAVTPTGSGRARALRHATVVRMKPRKSTSVLPVRTVPIPGAGHCLSRQEPVKGA